MGLLDLFLPGRKLPAPAPDYWATMYHEAVSKLQNSGIPKDQLHLASTVRGFFTGLVMGMNHREDRAALFSHCVNGIRECAMVQAEFQEIFADLEERGLLGEAIYNDDAAMELLTEAGTHSGIANLRQLYNTMPHQATKLSVAFGMLFALRFWRDHPSLAQHLVDCEHTRDEADAPEADAAPERDASPRFFDELAMLAFPVFYNETRTVEDRVKDAICGGLIFGLTEACAQERLQLLLSPTASADTAFAQNISDTAKLANIFVNGPTLAEAMEANPRSSFAAEVIGTALCQMMLRGRDLDREAPRGVSCEGLRRGLAFALVLWRDHPRIAGRLAESITRRSNE